FRNKLQTPPNLPGTLSRMPVISKVLTLADENELADESSQLPRSDKKEPAAFVANSDEARASGGKAEAIPKDRRDRQSAANRWRSRLPALAPEFSTRSRKRRAHPPRSPKFEIVRFQGNRSIVEQPRANRPVCDLVENSNRECRGDRAK